MIAESQEQAIALLLDAASYGSGEPVEQIETHISRIFLAGDRAFKMKRAVHLPYVDFSTPQLRLAACRKEVELNSITAPGLYLGVRRITREPTASSPSMATANWSMQSSRWSASTSRSCSIAWQWPEH